MLLEVITAKGDIFQGELEEQFHSESSSFKVLNDGLIVGAIIPECKYEVGWVRCEVRYRKFIDLTLSTPLSSKSRLAS